MKIGKWYNNNCKWDNSPPQTTWRWNSRPSIALVSANLFCLGNCIIFCVKCKYSILSVHSICIHKVWTNRTVSLANSWKLITQIYSKKLWRWWWFFCEHFLWMSSIITHLIKKKPIVSHKIERQLVCMQLMVKVLQQFYTLLKSKWLLCMIAITVHELCLIMD